MILRRDDESALRTFGQFFDDDGTLLCQTLELPWRDNHASLSRIPAGTYTAFRFDSPTIGYQLFQLRNVPRRSGIDVHIGNTVRDTKGCILVGTARGTLDYPVDGVDVTFDAVLHSRDAFRAFMTRLAALDDFPLRIVDAPIPIVA